MKPAALAVCIVLFATPALADDVSADLACKMRHPVSEVGAFSEMPPPVVNFVRARMGAGNLPDSALMAGRGAYFNATDVIVRPAPGRRFIRAGHAGDLWFLWYEHGGIAYSKTIAIMELRPGTLRLVALLSYFNENPCTLTDRVLDGRAPLPENRQGWW